MAHANGLPDTLEKHQHEVCGAFARAAVAMRDAAQTAENFSNWFSRVNNLQNVPVPPMFNGSYNFSSQFPGQQHQQLPQSSEAEETGKKRKISGDQEGKKKRPVKEKKPHDPNAPKRPPSAYLLFQNDVRKDVKGQHPDMPYSQVLAEISKLWHALTPEEKAPYMQATADSKIIYNKAKASYEAESPTEAKDVKEVKGASTKPSTSKSKVPALSSVADKPAAKVATTSDDEDDDEDETTSSPSSDKSSEEDEEDEIVEEAPEPPRKKAKKDSVRESSPPSVKVVEKMKKKEGKEKKRK